MFRKLDSNKRKMGESSSAPLKASKTGPHTEVIVDDPFLVTPYPTATPTVFSCDSTSFLNGSSSAGPI